ncbi:MAG TPA: 3-hydroxyacyl-CoA dehydrogenase family protein [Spirochaetota bacterium]|nr:3-hydroxyacyl-CoA dehydrogenase family protein [Spirochaetota bacterium]HPJ38728.1 3-hydroxyacyl-CoA dehydrogenase family protein [Spirochaetota bacterium]HPQ52146.1 3-hydroxyacyl-CoA dehydrogenase family protein [Spirochaetota bacterium]
MDITDVKTIAIIGAGNMGHQLAVHCALCGFETTCTDVNTETLKKAESFAGSYLKGRVDKGKLSPEEAEKTRGRLLFTSSLKAAVENADYIIEAAVENLATKRKLFSELDMLAPSRAILATNSSRIVSSRIADATKRPEKVCNLHFFNPALVMKLVEVVKGPHCADDTVKVSYQLCEKLGKIPVMLNKEIDGFLLNRMLGALAKEALWLQEMGIASYEDLDKAAVYGAGHPMGPFRLMDLTGIDLEYMMRMEAFRNTGDRNDLPAPSVVERYMKGEYGEKSGRGWYEYGKN